MVIIILELIQKFQKYWNYFYSIQQRPFLGRNIIVSSVCPNLYGLYLVGLSSLTIIINDYYYYYYHRLSLLSSIIIIIIIDYYHH